MPGEQGADYASNTETRAEVTTEMRETAATAFAHEVTSPIATTIQRITGMITTAQPGHGYRF